VRHRDFWDWSLWVAGIIATTVAIPGFLTWALRQRRRPEARFYWRWSPTGRVEELRDWEPHEVATMRKGEGILVEASILNVGDATGLEAMTNFVVPACMFLRAQRDSDVEPLTAQNGTAGLPPDWRAVFLARERPMYPGMWWQQRFVLSLESDPGVERVRFLMELSDDRLNARGRRLLPSFVRPPDEPAGTPVGESWPGPTRGARRLRRIRAQPDGRVQCAEGVRRDVRDVEIAP